MKTQESKSDKLSSRQTTAYPLMQKAAELNAASGRSIEAITIDALAKDELTGQDLQIDADTLHTQSQIAKDAGYPQLAANLNRAAELTRVPNDELLRMYEMLRPGRSTKDDLATLADTLESAYEAPVTAAFVREALTVYQQRGLLKK
ncbi:MAG: diol dehydratase small subunit [Chloroflexota bacterium]